MDLQTQYARLCENILSDIYEYLPVFYEGTKSFEDPEIIELGVRAGVSTIAWLWAVEQVGGGHVWSVDGALPCLDDDGTDLLGQYLNDGVSTLDHWTFLKGWDNEQWVLDILPKQTDIVFIDTNHTFEMTMDELQTYYPRVKPGGLIYLHDTNIETTGNAVTPQPPYPVRTAVQQFCDEVGLRYEFIDSRCGLGTIYA